MQCHIDFETRSAADLRKCGSDVYAQHHTTDALCLAYAFGDEPIQLWTPKLPPPQKLLEHVKNGGICVGHNIGGFEMLIWNCVMTLHYGWPELHIEQCRDNMAFAYAMALPGSLDDSSRALGIAYQKDMAGHRIMMKLSQPKGVVNGQPVFWTPEEVPADFEKLYSYCKQDVEVERASGKRMLPLSATEQKMWELDFKINRRGVYVDLRAAHTAVQLVEAEKERLNKEMAQITNGAVCMCTAVGQLADWIQSKGVQVPSLAKADVVELLSHEIPPEVRAALLLRQEAAKTSTAKLQAMLNGASAGGRMRGLFQYHGASTGRWAGRRVQLQNLPRPKLKQEAIEHVFRILESNVYRFPSVKAEAIRNRTDSPAMSAISDCIRGFLRAAPGHDFIAADFSAIEARVIAWLAGQEDVLEVFRGDGKIYELTAAGIYACKLIDITKEDPRRQVGKVAVLALGYQGGVGAMQTMCAAYGVKLEPTFDLLWARATAEHKRMAKFVWDMNGKKYDISQKEFVAADLIKQYWREKNLKIVDYWGHLNQAAITAVSSHGQKFVAGAAGRQVTFVKNGSFLWCRLPSGRALCYPYPEIKMLKPFEDSDVKPTLTAMGIDSYTNKWERYKLYGGLIAENITQAVARDLMAEAMVRLEAHGYPVTLHVHDEAVTEVRKGFGSVEEMEKIMTANPAWAKDLPVAAEGWRGERFRK